MVIFGFEISKKESLMEIPEFQAFFYPFLKMSIDENEHSLDEVREYLAEYFSLSDEDRSQKVPSGTQTRFDNRIYWTKSYLIKANLIEATRRAHFRITPAGKIFFGRFDGRITINDLKEIEKFREFHSGSSVLSDVDGSNSNSSAYEVKTPLEKLEESYQIIKNELATELLEKIKANSWQFFEDLVVDLMVQMGYGGSRIEAGQSLKRSNDEGIDGIINEDRLGLDVIYIQAKKWTNENVVGRPEIQKFVGALHGKRAKKGVFITTTSFAKTAHEYVKTIDPKVILIDGTTLANLMIEYGLGTTVVQSYIISKSDVDYFEK